MCLNKDVPLRKDHWSCLAYKSSGSSEARTKWEEEKSI